MRIKNKQTKTNLRNKIENKNVFSTLKILVQKTKQNKTKAEELSRSGQTEHGGDVFMLRIKLVFVCHFLICFVLIEAPRMRRKTTNSVAAVCVNHAWLKSQQLYGFLDGKISVHSDEFKKNKPGRSQIWKISKNGDESFFGV